VLRKLFFSEKMTEEDLSRVEKSATKSTYNLGVGFEICEKKGEKSAPKFVPSSNYHKEEEALKPTKAHYPSGPKPSFNPKKEVKRETPSRERKFLFACFVAVLVTWMSFAFNTRELRRGALTMLETHIAMSSLSFHLVLTLVLCLSSLMDLTIVHMILVHKRTTLCLDAFTMAHVLIMVIICRVGLVFLLELLTLTLSPDTRMVHVFPIVVHVPLGQMAKCKEL
jgi:hypothetical protein